MAILDEYKRYKESKEERERDEIVVRDAEERLATQGIMSVLQSNNCKILWQNGYVFKFLFGNRCYSVCNQVDRIVGSSWLGGQPTEDEKEMLETLSSIERDNPDLYNKIVKKYDYKEIVIDGTPRMAFSRLMDGEFEYDEGERKAIIVREEQPRKASAWKRLWKMIFS